MGLWTDSQDTAQIVIVHPHYRRPLDLLSRILADEDATLIRVQAGWSAERVLHEVNQIDFTPEVVVLQDLDALAANAQRNLLRYARTVRQRWVVFTRAADPVWFHDPALGDYIRLYDDLDELGLIGRSERARLDVFAFGNGVAYLDGYPLTEWDGVMPRSLLFFMVHRRFASRDAILRTLWPELQLPAALNAFHVTKNRLRQLFGFSPLRHHHNRYCLSPDLAVNFDVQHFYDLLQPVAAENDVERAMRLRRALWLAPRGFLSCLDQAWAETPRHMLQHARSRALGELSFLLAAQGEYTEAMTFAQRALALTPRKPSVLLHLLRMNAHLGTPCDGLRCAEHVLSRVSPQSARWQDVLTQIAALREQCH